MATYKVTSEDVKLRVNTLKDCNLCYTAQDSNIYRINGRYGSYDIYDIGGGFVMVEGTCDRRRYSFDINKIKTAKGKNELKTLVMEFMASNR